MKSLYWVAFQQASSKKGTQKGNEQSENGPEKVPNLMLLNCQLVEQLGYASTQLLKNGCSGEGSLWSDEPSEGFYCLCEGHFCNDPNVTVGMDTRVAI